MEDEYSSESDDSQSQDEQGQDVNEEYDEKLSGEEEFEDDSSENSNSEDSSEADSEEEAAAARMKEEKLRQKLKECTLVLPGYENTKPPWSELLVITSNVTSEDMNIDDNLALEKHFFNQSMDGVAAAMKKLKGEGTDPFFFSYIR
jgi:hypothetical protein